MFSVVVIVRNEAKALPGLLQSLGYVPDLVLCDTGSTDETMKVAGTANAKLCTFDWCDDFAAARTYAEAHARYDWIVRVDADERIKLTGERIFTKWLCRHLERAESVGAGQVFVRRFHGRNDEHWFPRVHRRPWYQWKYPVHERIVPIDDAWPLSISAEEATFLHQREIRPRAYHPIFDPKLIHPSLRTHFSKQGLRKGETTGFPARF